MSPKNANLERRIEKLEKLLERRVQRYEGEISRLREARALAEATLASIGGAVVTTDADGRITGLNPVAESFTGWTPADAAGRHLDEVLKLVDASGDTGEGLDLEPCLRGGHKLFLTDSLTLEHRDGNRFTVEGSAAPIRHDGKIIGAVLTFDDVSEKQLMSLQLTRAASYDSLTGLLNREAFDHHVRQALAESAGGVRHVMCYMDLDQFKVVNDTCGHSAGDLLLQWIASLVREQVRDTDVLARLGGDEFGLLLPRCPLPAAQRVTLEIHRALKEFRFVWQDKNFAVGTSIGLVVLEPGFKDLDELMAAADHACYLAKRKGRGRTQVYRPDDVEIRQQRGQMDWVMKLRRALDENRFELHWQRIRPVADRAGPLVYEVLLRLRGDGVLHAPGEFLPAAERFDLMPSVDRWVVRRTLELLRAQPPRFLDRLGWCSINLSGASLGDGGLLEFIEEELDRTGFPAHRLCFEITETAAVSNLRHAVRMIERLSARQCRWALDDFGSGMSSYRYLRKLPVQYLKIDGNIVSDLLTSPLSRTMVQSIHQIGHVMNVETIAETVTSEAMFEALREIGVDYAQGFWIERPHPIQKRPRAGAARKGMTAGSRGSAV